ncbi:hypothetical protein D3C80_770570 [compost metagenome]
MPVHPAGLHDPSHPDQVILKCHFALLALAAHQRIPAFAGCNCGTRTIDPLPTMIGGNNERSHQFDQFRSWLPHPRPTNTQRTEGAGPCVLSLRVRLETGPRRGAVRLHHYRYRLLLPGLRRADPEQQPQGADPDGRTRAVLPPRALPEPADPLPENPRWLFRNLPLDPLGPHRQPATGQHRLAARHGAVLWRAQHHVECLVPTANQR